MGISVGYEAALAVLINSAGARDRPAKQTTRRWDCARDGERERGDDEACRIEQSTESRSQSTSTRKCTHHWGWRCLLSCMQEIRCLWGSPKE